MQLPFGLQPAALAALVGLTLVLGGSPSQAAIEANQATQAELETLTGIGPNLSARILRARHDSAFRNWDDLLQRVSGLGPANAARLSRAGLTVGGSAYESDQHQEGSTTAPKPASPRSDRSAKVQPAR